jgi:hypothetical protein
MNDSFTELETELKALCPQRPAAALLERIGGDLMVSGHESPAGHHPRNAAATNLGSWKWHGWRALGAVAAIALVAAVSWMSLSVGVRPSTVTSPVQPAAISAAAPAYQPVAAANVLYDLKDEGLVYVDGSTPARRLRYRYLDTYTWKNSRNNASLKWSVPRDEIRVLPTSLN